MMSPFCRCLGIQEIHAGLLASNGRGVLLVGPGGRAARAVAEISPTGQRVLGGYPSACPSPYPPTGDDRKARSQRPANAAGWRRATPHHRQGHRISRAPPPSQRGPFSGRCRSPAGRALSGTDPVDRWRRPLARRASRARRAARVGDRVIFSGVIERESIPSFLASARIVVVPSLDEPFGLVALEAAQCGRPVIATDIQRLPEIVSDGETGLLVPAGDPVALAHAIEALLVDDTLAARMGSPRGQSSCPAGSCPSSRVCRHDI